MAANGSAGGAVRAGIGQLEEGLRGVGRQARRTAAAQPRWGYLSFAHRSSAAQVGMSEPRSASR